MNQPLDKLIYGKNQTTRIVNIEVEDGLIHYYTQDLDGKINYQTKPIKLWLLTNKPLEKNSVKLKGKQHFQYGTQYISKDAWMRGVNVARKYKIDLYTIWNDIEAIMVKDGYTYFKDMKFNEPSILSFDIESTGLYHNENSKVLLISNTFRKNGIITRKLFAYDEYKSQGEMLEAWSNWIREIDPSIICGHNIYSFDFPYINYIAEKEGVTLNLGRNGSPLNISQKASRFRIDGSRDQEYHKVRIFGREVIDTMFLAIKYDIAAKKYESYGLKSIIKVEGLEKENRVMYDASKIRINYTNPKEWQKIKAYCEHDADDSLALYDLMGASLFYLTQSVPKPYQVMLESATGSQINAVMVRSYLQEGHSIAKTSDVRGFQGAISRGVPGIYKNCVRWDVAGLYPSIILQYNVFDSLKDPEQNFLKIMQIFTKERLKNKNLAKETNERYYDDLQSSQKIVANSGYGFLGAPGLNYNSPECAEFITQKGREILQKAIEWATNEKYETWEKQFEK